MSNIWILIRSQLINFFPINEIRGIENKKQSSMEPIEIKQFLAKKGYKIENINKAMEQ